MPAHHETRILPYSPQQMFDLVADVARYQEFLPWCVGSRINWRKGSTFNADVLIGYSFIREVFNSTVTLTPYECIEVKYQNGPFRHLKNNWRFRENGKGCEVVFDIDFEFRTGLLNSVIQTVFEEAVHKMVGAFEARAGKLY
jgi:coenzyme Q-binding protein COQ10